VLSDRGYGMLTDHFQLDLDVARGVAKRLQAARKRVNESDQKISRGFPGHILAGIAGSVASSSLALTHRSVHEACDDGAGYLG